MSNEATATKKIKFNEASAERKPTLVCTGYVSKVDDTYLSEKEVYNVTPISINGIGASPSVTKWICTRPEWFEINGDGNPVFEPKELEKVEGGKNMLKVYRSTISGRDKTSAFKGLAGSEERFEDLSNTLFTTDGVAEEDGVILTKVLREFLVAKEGTEPFQIGYILKQQKVNTGRFDSNGKPIYDYEKNYGIDDWFEVTPQNLKRYRKAAEKSAELAKKTGERVTFKVCFDEATPF